MRKHQVENQIVAALENEHITVLGRANLVHLNGHFHFVAIVEYFAGLAELVTDAERALEPEGFTISAAACTWQAANTFALSAWSRKEISK